jgi:hypothetical protein
MFSHTTSFLKKCAVCRLAFGFSGPPCFHQLQGISELRPGCDFGELNAFAELRLKDLVEQALSRGQPGLAGLVKKRRKKSWLFIQ